MNQSKIRLKNFKEKWNRNSWMIAGTLGVVGFFLGIYGFTPFSSLEELSNAFYKTLQMAVLEFGETSEIEGKAKTVITHHLSRVLLPAALSIAVIQGILETIHRRGGGVRLRFLWKDHIVICGSGSLATEIARAHLNRETFDKVAVANSGNDDDAFAQLVDEGAVVLREDPARLDAMIRLRLDTARVVYIASEDDQANLRLFTAIANFIAQRKSRSSPLICLLHCQNRILAQRVLDSYLYQNAPEFTTSANSSENQGAANVLDVRPFNSWQDSARALYQHLGPDVFYPVCKDTPHQPHAIIIGRNRFSEQLIDQGAFLGHYIKGQKLRITLLGSGSEEWLDETMMRHPPLRKGMPDGFWHEEERPLIPVIDLDADSRADYTQFLIKRRKDLSHAVIYICIDSLPDALDVAQSLEQITGDINMPIVVCGPKTDEQCINLPNSPIAKSEKEQNMGSRIYGFSTTSHGLRLEKTERFLREHLDTKALQLHESFTSGKVTTAKKHQVSQSTYFEWMRESSRQAISHLAIKARATSDLSRLFSAQADKSTPENSNELELLSRMEHQRWCAERLMFGWRYDVARDNKNLKHPDIKIFDKLNEATQKKDQNIINALHALTSPAK